MKSTAKLAAIAICAAVFGAFLAPSQSARAAAYNDKCNGTSECAGNLLCHKGSVLGGIKHTSGICVCPERGDGSFTVSKAKGGRDFGHSRADCWGAGVPREMRWRDGRGAD